MHQHIDENTLVCFVHPEINNIQAAKNLFRAVSYDLNLACVENDILYMSSERKNPFSTYITLTLTPHPTKGYLGVLQTKPINKLHSFGASLLPSWFTCTSSLSECKQWYECPKHYTQGLEQYHKGFFCKYIQAAKEQNILFSPLDTNPICLDASCIPINTVQSSCVGLNEKVVFYSDFAAEQIAGKQITIKVISLKRIQLLLRYQQRPSTFLCDSFAVSLKQSDSSFITQIILNHHSDPSLRPGRWFFSIRGSSLISRSTLTVSLESMLFSKFKKPFNFLTFFLERR